MSSFRKTRSARTLSEAGFTLPVGTGPVSPCAGNTAALRYNLNLIAKQEKFKKKY